MRMSSRRLTSASHLKQSSKTLVELRTDCLLPSKYLDGEVASGSSRTLFTGSEIIDKKPFRVRTNVPVRYRSRR
jgi:hypothetical protein